MQICCDLISYQRGTPTRENDHTKRSEAATDIAV